MTGSPRYMAPGKWFGCRCYFHPVESNGQHNHLLFSNNAEVALEKNYNEQCDVYSFAIMLWQMYSLKTPFELYTVRSLKARVWAGEHKRPFVDPSWPVPLKTLLKRAWSNDIKERPSFQQITKILRSECVRIRDGNEDGLEHSRRRSTFVFRGASRLDASKNSMKPAPRISDIQKAVMAETMDEDPDPISESAK